MAIETGDRVKLTWIGSDAHSHPSEGTVVDTAEAANPLATEFSKTYQVITVRFPNDPVDAVFEAGGEGYTHPWYDVGGNPVQIVRVG